MDNIEPKVKQAIRKVVNIPETEDIALESELANIGVDSFAGIELAFTLEDSFDITISDEEMAQMKTVRDVVDGIKQKKQ